MKCEINTGKRWRWAILLPSLMIVLALALSGQPSESETQELLVLASRVHGALFAELDNGERRWLRGLADAIGKGEMNEDELVKAVTGPASRKRVKPERAMFHACFLAVPGFDREIAKARKKIERLDQEIAMLEKRGRSDEATQHDLRELLKQAGEEREKEMILANALINKKSNSISLLGSIVKGAGSTEADVIKNLR